MPTDEAYHAVLEELGKIAQAWTTYREVVNRAVGLLNHEVINLTDRLDKFEAARRDEREQDEAARQKAREALDTKLETIAKGQASIRRWQFVRVAVEVVAVLIVLALIVGKLWL